MSNNVSTLGIDKDLDAMKQMGVAGVTVCPVGSTTGIDHTMIANTPWPGVTYLSPDWWALLRHATQRAGELGMEMGMHNCGGWSATGGPWITPELSMQKVVWSETDTTGPAQFSASLDQPDIDPKFNFYRDIVVIAVPARDKVEVTDCLDLTTHMAADGTLKWSVPAGKWQVYRFGHTTTGKTPHPMPDGFDGLECDKLSAHAATIHLQHVLDAVHQNLPGPDGKAFSHILFDSYEAGPQNWTDDFRQQFIKLRGYDPIPWLPVLAGQNIGGALAKRFQWDMAQTVSDLFVQNNFGVFHKMLTRAGLRMCLEPYKGPFDTISATAECDTPMGEFWTHIRKGIVRTVPTAAQALGETITGAESFTGNPIVSQWSETPASLKPVADAAICSGVNQFYLHEWTLQPFDDNIQPGLTAGWWGTHFGRNQTWFAQGKAFFDYLSRCAAVLQHGQVVSDYCTLEFAGDGADALSYKLLTDCTVEKGQIVAPSGRRYALLAISPTSTEMLPAVTEKLKALVAGGAVILAPKPTGSPSLSDYPHCDAQVSSIASDLWGDTTNANAHEHDFGRGKVYWNQTPQQVLAMIGIQPDFAITGTPPGPVESIHRREGDSDIYFIANIDDHPADVVAHFRVTGKVPELWHPEDASEQTAGQWKDNGTLTDLPLSLGPNQSIFVIFRHAAGADHIASATTLPTDADLFISADNNVHLQSAAAGSCDLQYASGHKQSIALPASPAPMILSGKWEVHFPTNSGTPQAIALDPLQSWTERSEPGVKYFSGSATYSKEFQVSSDFIHANQRVILDLGQLADIATAKLNDHDLGILWTPPFRVDVTDAIVPGTNHLEITITNTWRNRLIGDEQQPLDLQWGNVAIYNHKAPAGRPLAAFPDWLVAGKPRPSPQRYTFTTWNYFNKDSTLEKSGLFGPVTLIPQADIVVPAH